MGNEKLLQRTLRAPTKRVTCLHLPAFIRPIILLGWPQTISYANPEAGSSC